MLSIFSPTGPQHPHSTGTQYPQSNDTQHPQPIDIQHPQPTVLHGASFLLHLWSNIIMDSFSVPWQARKVTLLDLLEELRDPKGI